MGLIVAGDRSGTGKTTVTLALLAALTHRSQPVQSFKVGPDYIDPMFHRAVTGCPCYNLDPVLTSETYVQRCYQQHTTGYAVVEGVMGLFDGADGETDVASTAHIARLLNLPVLLVVDCARMSRSVAALVLGYRQLDPRISIAGVVLNRVGSERHLALLRSALNSISVPILGVFRRGADIKLPDRHLGLVPVGELSGFRQTVQRLAALGEANFEWPQLEAVFRQGQRQVRPDVKPLPTAITPLRSDPPMIAIAWDRAFNFYYPDNLAQLAQWGAILRYWSPMADAFPADVQGLYLGGGFPEVFAEALADNRAARDGVRGAIATGLPTYAECGGLMYLCQTLTDFDGQTWPMTGVLETSVEMSGQLSLGYRQSHTLQSGPVLPANATVTGHEFHRSRLQTALPDALYRSRRAFPSGPADGPYLEGVGTENLQASYLHLHWGSRPDIAERFVTQCRQWRSGLSAP
ncbi:MAG: cobyrinate a,c-diamide synthase [Cyanobacteria bacterium J06648_16]